MRKKVRSKSMLSRVKSVTEVSLVITALFYGRSGTGKTTLAGTFPTPMLVIDISEHGTDSLADQPGIDFLSIGSWQELEDLYWELEAGDHKYKTISIDAVHSMQALAIQEARDIAGKKERDQTSQRDFGQASGLMNTWIGNFRDLARLGINVLFLAHDKVQEVDTEDDGDIILPEVGPRLMPSVSSCLIGAVNIVGNTYIAEVVTKSKRAGVKPTREVQYRLRIGPHGYYNTKIRRPKKFSIPEYIVDPTYDKLVNVIQGKATDSSTKPKRVIRRK